MNSAYDVAIVGAGPAGSTAAHLLAKGGLRVALLDRSDFPRDKTCGDGLTPRAVGVLDSLGVLPAVARDAYRISALTMRNSDEVTYRLELGIPGGPERYILILPRLKLDEILLHHAVDAGAHFLPNRKVVDIDQSEDDALRLRIENGSSIESKLAIIATGANTSLLRKTGLLNHPPPSNLAARVYYEGVEDLDDTIMLFFDGVERPGYGWVFPIAPGIANIGCGVFFDSSTPQPSHLAHLLKHHPHLQRILKNARPMGSIKGYPLRTDFSPSLSGRGHLLVVGEAVGLVNPITGEGIDYALESAQLAAQSILTGWAIGLPPAPFHRAYRRLLNRKFRLPFALGHWVQRLYFRDGIFDRILRRVQYRPHLHRIVVDSCFGLIDPISAFTPRTVWEVLKPERRASQRTARPHPSSGDSTAKNEMHTGSGARPRA